MSVEKKPYDDLYEKDAEMAKLNERIDKDNLRLRKLRQDRQIIYDTLRHNRKP